MMGRQKGKIVGEAIIMTGGILLFAGLIHTPHLLKIVAFSGLALSIIFIHNAIGRSSLKELAGLSYFSRRLKVFTGLSIILGVLTGSIARLAFHLSLLPGKLTFVALVSPLIGMTEELIFRGIIQGYVRPAGRIFAILFGAAGHTLYKFLVIFSLPEPLEINYLKLILLTFAFGSLMGYLRELSKNVLPAMVAHGVFDIILYGSFASMPVWVWG